MEKPFDAELMTGQDCHEYHYYSEEKEEPTKEEKKRPKLFETFTKLWVSILLIVALLDLQLSYFLAYLGREEIAETLSVAVVTEIIGVSAIYMVRAYFDTKTEKALNFEKDKFAVEMPEQTEDEYNEDGTVG